MTPDYSYAAIHALYQQLQELPFPERTYNAAAHPAYDALIAQIRAAVDARREVFGNEMVVVGYTERSHDPREGTAASAPTRRASTAAKQDAFLDALAHDGRVTAACDVAGITRTTVYRWDRVDVDFHARFHVARLQHRAVIPLAGIPEGDS